MPIEKSRLADNLAAVRERIAAACARAGRSPEAVTLVAVTKTVGAEECRMLCELGACDLGENRVPDGLAKAEALAELPIRWHMIGHLQRNKAARALQRFRIIHSVESEALGQILSRKAEEGDFGVDVFAEVNVAGEEQKYGLSPEGAIDFAKTLGALPRLNMRGLMTMAPWVEPEETRPVFRALRELRDRLRSETGMALPDLSMGMSNDFEIAVEEGATLVRVGSALFA